MDLANNKYELQGDNLEFPVRVVRIGKKTEYNTEDVHRHNYNELFFFENGGGNHMIDFETHLIENNSVHSVVSNKVHLVNRDKNSFGHVLLFKNDFFQSDLLKTNYSFLIDCEVINLTTDRFKDVRKIIEEIEKEINSDDLMKNAIIEAHIHLILMKLKQFVKTDSKTNYSSLTDNKLYKSFYLLLEDHFRSERKTHFYAEKLNLGDIVLNKELEKATGKTASKLIHDRLILESKRLLFHSNLSVKEISYNLNFTDTAHFSHFFKKTVRLTPSEFRETKKVQ